MQILHTPPNCIYLSFLLPLSLTFIRVQKPLTNGTPIPSEGHNQDPFLLQEAT